MILSVFSVYICIHMCMHKAKVPPRTFYIMPILEEMPQNFAFVLWQNPKSSGLEVKEICTFKIKMTTLNAPISTNKVSIFKLTTED